MDRFLQCVIVRDGRFAVFIAEFVDIQLCKGCIDQVSIAMTTLHHFQPDMGQRLLRRLKVAEVRHHPAVIRCNQHHTGRRGEARCKKAVDRRNQQKRLGREFSVGKCRLDASQIHFICCHNSKTCLSKYNVHRKRFDAPCEKTFLIHVLDVP